MSIEKTSPDIFDEAVLNGVDSLFDDYIKLSSSDTVIVSYTPDSREVASWVRLVLEERGVKHQILHMYPLRDPTFKKRLNNVMPSTPPVEGRLVLLFFENGTISHDEIIRDALVNYKTTEYFVVRSINSDKNLFATGLSVSPETLSALNTSVLERCLEAKKLRITTNSGTDLLIELDKKYNWISNNGTAKEGQFLIVPCGEVATFPKSISGKLVADFAMNVNMIIDIDARLNKCPITVNIEDNQMKSFSCSNQEITDFLNHCFKAENSRRVGELGIGTNISVVEPVFESSHLNERCPGVHLGFGQHNQDVEAAGYSCDIHLDLIAQGGLIWVDDSSEPIDLSNLKKSKNKHPDLISCEDVFSPA